MTTLTRADGSIQFTYKGMPVYYYTPDKAPGDGVGSVWHLRTLTGSGKSFRH